MPERPYSRVYWEVMDDPKFDGVREDVSHFGTWTLLLVVADMAWPAPAFLPPCPKKSVAFLVDRGLIEVMHGSRFRVRGMHKERSARSAAARESALHRWSERSASAMRPHSERNATGMLDETRLDKTRRDNGSQSDFDRRVEATQRELRRVRGES